MKRTLISGASSGLGEGLARELATRGWTHLALTARRADKLEALASDLRDKGCTVEIIACDIRESESVRSGVGSVIEEWGGVDLAVANAGISYPTPAKSLDVEESMAIMQTNFDGMLHLFAPVIPSMLEARSGHLVGVASLAGLRGLPGASMYSASKSAMQSWLEAVRIELVYRGIAVTTVNPGFIRTPLTDKNKYRMPFVMSVEKASRIICDGLEKKKRTIEFPLRLSLMLRFGRLLPGFVYDRIASPYGKRKVDAGSGKSKGESGK